MDARAPARHDGPMTTLLTPRTAAWLVALASAALLLGALAFQYLGDLAPCPLCIRQRYPHALAIALALLSLALPPMGARIALALAGLSLLAGVFIGIDHAGIEYGWWPGSAECTPAAPTPGSLAELNAQLAAPAPPRCDAPAWTLFGLSLAGYNVLASLPLAALALGAALKGHRPGDRA